jgi:arsenate reductase
MALTLWHNPRCSKSRAALALLRDRGVEPDLRLYLKSPPIEAELVELLRRLGIPAIGLVRTREPVFQELDLADADDTALIAAMAAHPILIERPIVEDGNRAVIGRPPENVLALI